MIFKKLHLEVVTGYPNRSKITFTSIPTDENVVSLRGLLILLKSTGYGHFLIGLDFAGSYQFTDNLSGLLPKLNHQSKDTDENNTTSLSSPLNRMDWGIAYSFGKKLVLSPTNWPLSTSLVSKQKREPDFGHRQLHLQLTHYLIWLINENSTFRETNFNLVLQVTESF